MTLYDIVMIVVFAGAVGFGYLKGLAWQIASVAAIAISYIVAVKFREPVSQFIQAEEPWNRIGAMLVLFLGSSFVIWTVYAYLNKSIRHAELKGFDRQSGAVLGGFTGILLCMVITMFSVSMLGEQAHEAIHHSKVGPYVVRGISQVSSIVPKELTPYINPQIERFQQQIGHDADLPLNQYPAHQNSDGSVLPFGLGSSSSGSPQLPTTGNQPRTVYQGNWTMTPGVDARWSTQNNPTSNDGVFPSPIQQTGAWEAPKLDITVDSENILNRLWDRMNNPPPATNGGNR